MKLRAGELTTLAGCAVLIVGLTRRWYETPTGNLSFWDTFGPAAVLMLVAGCAGLALVVSALLERESPTLPVSATIWAVLLGLIGTIAALVRVLERPQHASGLCAGAWLGLGAAALIFLGAWLTIHDERPSRYRPARPEPRPRP